MRPVFLEGAEWFDADSAIKWVREVRDEVGFPFKRTTLWRTRHGSYVLETDEPDREGDWKRVAMERFDSESALVWLVTRGLDLPDDLVDLQAQLEI